jgi:AraC-like DNA-binding protein
MLGARGAEAVRSRTASMESRGTANAQLMEAIVQLADWISEVIEDERVQIKRPESADFGALVARKSHLALELGRLMQVAQGQTVSEPVRKKLQKLSQDLAANERLLRRHMDAVYEISSLIGEAIEQSTADGTYSSEIARQGPKSW